jgi:hypothetical protein
MGYAAFSGNEFSARFVRDVGSAGSAAVGPGHAEGMDRPWGKLIGVSDFPQAIVVRPSSFGRFHPRATLGAWRRGAQRLLRFHFGI